MGLHFGELAFIRGIIYYKLSPHEQKPFAKASAGITNFIYRTSASIHYWLPVFTMGYLTYTSVESTYHHSKRKNLADYENEIDPNASQKKPCS